MLKRSFGYPAKILETAEGVFDEMAVLVACFVVADFPFSIGSTGNYGNGSPATQTLAKSICIIALIRNQIAHGASTVDQVICSGDVGHIARRQHQDVRSAQNIRQRMDLGGLTAPAGTNIIRFRPPLPPNAARWAFT
jgi:hypothetical protein